MRMKTNGGTSNHSTSPLQGLYEMLHVFVEKLFNRPDGVVIRCTVEIQCTSQEMTCAVSYKKLFNIFIFLKKVFILIIT